MADLSLGILFGLLSMLGYGLMNALAKPLVHKMQLPALAFSRNILICAMLAVLLSFQSSVLPLNTASFSWPMLPAALFIMALAYLPVAAFYRALQIGKVGVVAPLASSSILFTVLLSVLFLHETLSFMHWLSILLILLGVLSLSFNLRDWRSASGPALIAEAPLALLAGTLWGLVYFLSKYMVLWFGALPAAFMLELGVLAGAGIHLLHSKGRLSLPPHPLLPTLALLALCGVAGTLFYNLGLESANVSIVAALCFSSPLVAALYGLVVYKEKLGIWQWGAMGLILAGIVMLQFSA